MMNKKVCIVMRSRNDMPIIAETLAMLHRQDVAFTLVVFDNNSQDGSLAEIEKYQPKIIHVPEGKYIPGFVLNQGMQVTDSDIVVFLNSDCVPQHTSWLANLLNGFADTNVAAVFTRQIPRKDCLPLFAKDTENTYGDGHLQRYWRHCFSMASSAIRRDVWEKMAFSETLKYSEDIDWTWRARQNGYKIRYVADAVVMHSHNYTWQQYYKRQYGEGYADALIFSWESWRKSWLRYAFLPYVRLVLGDIKYCIKNRKWSSLLQSPYLRCAQLFGRWSGFNDGQKAFCKKT